MVSNILCAFYVVGFAVPACLPRGRWFFGGLAIVAIFFGKAWYDVHSGAGPGDIFGRLAFQWLAAGAMAALLTRLAMEFAPAARGRGRAGILFPAGFLAGGAVAVALLS